MKRNVISPNCFTAATTTLCLAVTLVFWCSTECLNAQNDWPDLTRQLPSIGELSRQHEMVSRQNVGSLHDNISSRMHNSFQDQTRLQPNVQPAFDNPALLTGSGFSGFGSSPFGRASMPGETLAIERYSSVIVPGNPHQSGSLAKRVQASAVEDLIQLPVESLRLAASTLLSTPVELTAIQHGMTVAEGINQVGSGDALHDLNGVFKTFEPLRFMKWNPGGVWMFVLEPMIKQSWAIFFNTFDTQHDFGQPGIETVSYSIRQTTFTGPSTYEGLQQNQWQSIPDVNWQKMEQIASFREQQNWQSIWSAQSASKAMPTAFEQFPQIEASGLLVETKISGLGNNQLDTQISPTPLMNEMSSLNSSAGLASSPLSTDPMMAMALERIQPTTSLGDIVGSPASLASFGASRFNSDQMMAMAHQRAFQSVPSVGSLSSFFDFQQSAMSQSMHVNNALSLENTFSATRSAFENITLQAPALAPEQQFLGIPNVQDLTALPPTFVQQSPLPAAASLDQIKLQRPPSHTLSRNLPPSAVSPNTIQDITLHQPHTPRFSTPSFQTPAIQSPSFSTPDFDIDQRDMNFNDFNTDFQSFDNGF